MKIGFDLDGVVFNSESLFATLAEIYDCKELNRNSLIDREAPRVQEKYNWTDDECNTYFKKYILREDFDIMPGAKEVIKLLKDEGHELIVVTARGLLFDEEIDVAKNKLKQNGIKFDNYFWKCEDKREICENEKIDIMIDDRNLNCEEVAKTCKKVFHFRGAGVKGIDEIENIEEVSNWGEIYRAIHEEKNVLCMKSI